MITAIIVQTPGGKVHDIGKRDGFTACGLPIGDDWRYRIIADMAEFDRQPCTFCFHYDAVQN